MASPRETTAELKKAMAYFWSSVYADTAYVDALTGSVGIRAQTTRHLEEQLKNYTSRYEIPVFR